MSTESQVNAGVGAENVEALAPHIEARESKAAARKRAKAAAGRAALAAWDEIAAFAPETKISDLLAFCKRLRSTGIFAGAEGAARREEAATRLAAVTGRERGLFTFELHDRLYPTADEGVTDMNRIAARLLGGGDFKVLVERPNDSDEPYALLPTKAAKDYFAAWQYADSKGEDVVLKPVFDAWLRSPAAREYSRTTFDPAAAPGGVDGGVYNRWNGFPLEPLFDDGARCRGFVQHVYEIVCDGDDEAFTYLMAWFAHLVQHPEKKPGTAPVIHGKQGAGKSIIVKMLGKVLGKYCVTEKNLENIAGKYNDHFAEALLVAIHDMPPLTDPGVIDVVKTFVTDGDDEGSWLVEKKYAAKKRSRNFARVLCLSNHPAAAPVKGADERRFAAIESSSGRLGDDIYFESLFAEIERPGVAESFFGLLLEWRPSYGAPREIPKGRAFGEALEARLSKEERWLHDALTNGAFAAPVAAAAADPMAPDEFAPAGWPDGAGQIAKADARLSFAATTRLTWEPLRIANLLNKYLPGIDHDKREALGERRRLFVLPPLEACRVAFAARTGVRFVQGDDEPPRDPFAAAGAWCDARRAPL